MHTYLLATILSLFVLVASVSTTSAQVNTAPAAEVESETATNSAITEEIKKRIQKHREQVKGVIDKLTSEKRAKIGEVQRITDETITIGQNGTTTIIPLTDRVQLLKEKKPIPVSDVAVGNWVVIMGTRERTQIDPEYVLISTESLRPKPHIVVIGSITEISRTSVTIQPRSQDESKTITLIRGTSYQAANGSEAALSDFSKDITILVTGFVTDTGIEAATVRSLAPVR